jgi:hypothetical protein
MLSKILDTFIDEIKKDENQELINNFINPYIYNIKLILVLLFLLLLTNICMSAYIINFKTP